MEAAVRAAKNAFPIWSSKSPLERSQILNKLADLIEYDLEAFAQAESKDQGKNLNYWCQIYHLDVYMNGRYGQDFWYMWAFGAMVFRWAVFCPDIIAVSSILFQAKQLHLLELWTSLGQYTTSGSLPLPSFITWQSAPRWQAWAVCIIPHGRLWELVRCSWSMENWAVTAWDNREEFFQT